MTQYTISENIRHHRKRVNLTQAELAEKLFVTSQTISKWEKGLTYPSLDNIVSLSELFGISIDCLLKTTSTTTSTDYIAIDGGGTKTEFILFKETGEIIKRIVLEGTNPNVVGVEKAFFILKTGIDILKSSQSDIKGIFLGIAGCGSRTNNDEISKLLKKAYPSIKFKLESDITNVIHSVRNVNKCVAAICGTGVSTFAYDGESLCQVGGWGYLFDCAGSGFDIGRDALRYALEYEADLALYSPLYDSIVAKHGKPITSSIHEIYRKGNEYIASFAFTTFEAYMSGDTKAEEIIRRSCHHLATLINKAAEKYQGITTCIMSGGLTKDKEILNKFIKEKLNPNISLIFPKHPQIYGAMLKCMALFGPREYDTELFDSNYNIITKEGAN